MRLRERDGRTAAVEGHWWKIEMFKGKVIQEAV